METTRTFVQPVVTKIRVKSVTLAPGQWVYVCPCGCRYRVSRVFKTTSKNALYCFACKEQKGKYYKVMDERLDFGINPNGILLCDCFAMLRLAHPVKNAVGSIKQIYLKGIWKGNARIIYTRLIRLDEITPEISYLAAGKEPEPFKQQIKKKFKGKPINWETQQFDYCILQYDKNSRQPSLF